MRAAMLVLVGLFAFAPTALCAEETKDGYFTASDGVKIHYVTSGDSGSWVVLIHGYTGSAEGNWYANGVASALSRNHRVVALDCRNHGKSDKPQPGGRGIPGDVVELMDHLQIERAHLHGYSMGGAITARLMADIPDRIITASFGGSGIRETDPELAKKAEALDAKGSDPREAEIARVLRIRSAMENGLSRADAEKRADELARAATPTTPGALPAVAAAGATASEARPGAGPVEPPRIDLTQVKYPVIAIIGEFDSPNARTARMSRELPDFKLTVLPGKSHLTAIAAPTMPKEYPDTLVAFIDANDEKK
jgi:pimeloyl-ACP methyl ester carboxylesterase